MHLEDFPEQNSGGTDGPSGENLLSTLGPPPENLKKLAKYIKRSSHIFGFIKKGSVRIIYG